MFRVDFYVQHLLKQGAQEVVLLSGAPVKFRFAEGDKQSSQSIDHAQVTLAVQETAPPSALDDLRRIKRAIYPHVTESGAQVTVEIEAQSAQVWRVTIKSRVASPVRPQATAGASAATSQVMTTPRMDESGGASSSTASASSNQTAQSPQTAHSGLSGQSSPAHTAQGAPQPAVAKPADRGKIESHHSENAIQKAGTSIQEIEGEPKLNKYLRTMIAVKASDLHMSTGVVPMVRQHGEMCPLFFRSPIEDAEMQDILFEVMPERNRNDFNEKNDSDWAYPIEGLARFRMNYFRDRNGIGLVARQIPFEIVPPEKLGVPPKVLNLCYLSKGLVLVTGPTGSGKSTTLAALIDYINQNRGDHIITIEDPIEFVHPNKKCLVNQREVGVHTQTFKSALKAALREDPDIVLVGEMRDLETISIAVETAETGHLVFGTLHTTSAPSTVDRIIDQFPADRQEQIRTMLAESLKGVVSQMLCKKKGGGRVAAYEILMGNSAVANLIREGKVFQLKSVMQTSKNLGMQIMNDHLLELVKTDKVEPEEAYLKSNDKAGIMDAFKKNNIAFTPPIE